MAKSEEQIETELSSIIGTMAIEGITLDDETIAHCRGILSGELDADEVVDKLFADFRADIDKSDNERGTG